MWNNLQYDFRLWRRRSLEQFEIKVARLLPHWLVYRAIIRACAHATTGPWGSEETPAVLAVDVLQRWGR
jgi:hypothetical protein